MRRRRNPQRLHEAVVQSRAALRAIRRDLLEYPFPPPEALLQKQRSAEQRYRAAWRERHAYATWLRSEKNMTHREIAEELGLGTRQHAHQVLNESPPAETPPARGNGASAASAAPPAQGNGASAASAAPPARGNGASAAPATPPVRGNGASAAPSARGNGVAAQGGVEQEALAAFDVALEQLAKLRARTAAAGFGAALALVREAEAQGGRVHVTGIGKPEHIARYAAALFSSTGTPAAFLHGTEARHGSAGQVVAGDVVIAISNSGETELVDAVDVVSTLGARIIAVTGRANSPLAERAEVVLDAGVAQEGGGIGLAPRASAAAQLVVLAAFSAALERARGFTRAEHRARHPAGALGRLPG